MRGFVAFLGTRLARAFVALWLVSTVVFVVMRLSGDPVPLLLPPDAPRSEIFRVRAELGLDRPIIVQYGVFLAHTLGAFAMASIARLTRSAMLEVLNADFVRTARAKGVSELFVVVKHTLRNAALPIITITGLQLGQLLAGAVVTETVFAWPGIGRLAIQSIYNRDYPIVQCTVFLSALAFIAINLMIDVLYGVLDPRLRAR